MYLIWSPILVQLRPMWKQFTLEDACPLSWEQLWAAYLGRKHRLQLRKIYVKPLVNKWRQWVRTVFLYLRQVESYCHYTGSAVSQLSSTVRNNFVVTVKENSAAFCLKDDIQNVSSTWKVIVSNWLVIQWWLLTLHLLRMEVGTKVCICNLSWDRLYWKSRRVLCYQCWRSCRSGSCSCVSPTNTHTDIQLDFTGDK